MKRLIAVLLSLIVASSAALPAAAQTVDAVVNTPLLNMRVAPDPSSARIATLPFGTQLDLIARDAAGRWVQVLLPTGVSGWVNASFLALFINIAALPIGIPSQIAPPAVTGIAFVSTGALNVRSGPGANFSIIGRLFRSDSVTLVGRNGDASWLQVITSSSLGGWMSARFLTTSIPIFNLPVTNGTGLAPGFVPPVPSGGTAAFVNVHRLNVRTGPGLHFPRFATLALGTGVNLSARNLDATWLLVQLADGRIGWVSARFVTTSFPIFNLPVR